MLYKEIENENVVLKIYYDTDCESPREWENIGTMVCWHRRYDLGDKHDFSDPDEFLKYLFEEYCDIKKVKEELFKKLDFRKNDTNWEVWLGEEFLCESPTKRDAINDVSKILDEDLYSYIPLDEKMKMIEEKIVILPLYLYDHSGITIFTSPFSCPWDSGQVGYIYATKEKFLKETGYTENELFSTDKHRIPTVGERVKIKGREDFGQVIAIENNIVTIDFDYNKFLDARKPENVISVIMENIIEVMSNRAVEILEGEVEIYDMYLRGNVYGYKLMKKEKCETCGDIELEEIDSCWGFYGDDVRKNGMLESIPDEYRDMLLKIV